MYCVRFSLLHGFEIYVHREVQLLEDLQVCVSLPLQAGGKHLQFGGAALLFLRVSLE